MYSPHLQLFVTIIILNVGDPYLSGTFSTSSSPSSSEKTPVLVGKRKDSPKDVSSLVSVRNDPVRKNYPTPTESRTKCFTQHSGGLNEFRPSLQQPYCTDVPVHFLRSFPFFCFVGVGGLLMEEKPNY